MRHSASTLTSQFPVQGHFKNKGMGVGPNLLPMAALRYDASDGYAAQRSNQGKPSMILNRMILEHLHPRCWPGSLTIRGNRSILSVFDFLPHSLPGFKINCIAKRLTLFKRLLHLDGKWRMASGGIAAISINTCAHHASPTSSTYSTVAQLASLWAGIQSVLPVRSPPRLEIFTKQEAARVNVTCLEPTVRLNIFLQ